MRFNGLALVVSAVVLGACGGGDKGAAKPDSAVQAPPAAAAPTPAAPTVPAMPATGKTIEVKMNGDGTVYKFEPAVINVKVGDKIKFINSTGGPHNVMFDAAEVPAAAKAQLIANMANPNNLGELSGPMLGNPNEATEISFAGIPAGEYTVHCQPHLAMNMKATIKVTP